MIVTTPYVPDPEGFPGGRMLGATLRARRVGAGLTLRRCAEQMGVSMERLSRVERGIDAMTVAERDGFERAILAGKEQK